MLNSLKLRCFRQHTDRTIEFSNGINAIRGANESGKSSILEAVGYCLFGARSLRTPIEQAVTWGEDAKRLQVVLTLTVEGTQYIISRSKAGAEVVVNDRVFVTGQNEVTNFASKILGADSGAASRLMLAGQNSIRGALEEGPKALSQMIEDLAGFTVFDQILESANTLLLLGPTASTEQRLKAAEAVLESATANLAPQPDAALYEKEVRDLQEASEFATSSLPFMREALEVTTKSWQDASALYLKRNQMAEEVERKKRQAEEADAAAAALAPAAKRVVDVSSIETLNLRIKEGQEYDKTLKAYKEFQSLPVGPVWKGSEEGFQSEVVANANAIRALEMEDARLEFELKTLRNQLFDTDTCNKCGQKLSNAKDIETHNERLDRLIRAVESKRVVLAPKMAVEERDKVRFKEIAAHAADYNRAAGRLGYYVKCVEGSYPMSVEWCGRVPDKEAPDVPALQRELRSIEADVRAVESAKAKLELAVEQAQQAHVAYREASRLLREFVSPSSEDVIALNEERNRVLVAVGDTERKIVEYGERIREATKEFQHATELWQLTQSRVTDAERTIAECKADLEVLTFNNALVKKLRTIRPVIAAKLWNTVLASVSVMFSTMRKEESWVTKEKSGFMVNGQAVESLSGSTLDILGLAIRCAMLRTFLPQCGLLVLDEPGHGCDSERIESMLGFLKGVNFQQTLLVSHEEVSESVADNLIIL